MAEGIVNPRPAKEGWAHIPTKYNNLLNLAHTPINAEIDRREYGYAILQSPFVPLASAFNLRDVGLLPGSTVKPGLIYRSGTIHKMEPDDLAFLRDALKVKTVFDLRSKEERARHPSPEVEGVETIWVEGQLAQRLKPAEFVSNGGLDGFMKLYGDILRHLAPSYKAVFEFILENPTEPFLFHCTAGKDRTGVLAMLLLMLTDCPTDVLAEDYMLTRLGVERERELLNNNLKAWLGPDALNQPGVLELGTVNMATAEEFVKRINQSYGGADGYLHNVLGFSEEEIAQIRRSILYSKPPTIDIEQPSGSLDITF